MRFGRYIFIIYIIYIVKLWLCKPNIPMYKQNSLLGLPVLILQFT